MYVAAVVVLVAAVSGCASEPGSTAAPAGTAYTSDVPTASPALSADPDASSSAAAVLDAAKRERIEQAQRDFDELLTTAPTQRQRFLVSLAEPLAATTFLSLPADQLKSVEDVYAWNMPPGEFPAISGQTAVHTDNGLLRASELRESIVRFLDGSIDGMKGKGSQDQVRSYRQLRASMLADPDALTVSGWSCQCTPTEVVALLDSLAVEATAVEATPDTGGGPIWPEL